MLCDGLIVKPTRTTPCLRPNDCLFSHDMREQGMRGMLALESCMCLHSSAGLSSYRLRWRQDVRVVLFSLRGTCFPRYSFSSPQNTISRTFHSQSHLKHSSANPFSSAPAVATLALFYCVCATARLESPNPKISHLLFPTI
jgi:hypothetical protein